MKKNVLIDSHGWIEYFAQGPLASKYAPYIEAANPANYITPVIVLYEVYKRIKSVKGEEHALKAIAHIIDNTKIILITKKISLSAADVSILTKLAMADALIKTIAKERNATLITGDKHFKGMENVVFIV